MTKEESSAAYIKKILRNNNEYLGFDDEGKKELIECNLYDMERAYKDGWDAGRHLLLDNAIQWIKEHINESIINVSTEEEFKVIIGGKLWQRLKKAMED